MLPTITLSEEQRQTIKSLKFPGDLAFFAGNLSVDLLSREVGDLGQAVGLDREVATKALIGQNLVGIPEEKHEPFLKLATKRQQYKRAIIKDAIANLNGFDFTEIERAILFGFLDMAHLFDELFLQWRSVVVESELGKQAAADPSFMTKFRAEHKLSLSPYTFSVIALKDGSYTEQPLPLAFPESTKQITDAVRQLGSSLRTLQADESWLAYVDALAGFFENVDSTKYEQLSKQLDVLFLHVSGRLIPLHAMEVYDDPGKYCVTPEMRLCIVDDRYKHVNDGIETTRANVVKRLSEVYAAVPALGTSIPLMQRALAKAVTPLCEAGASMTLRPFGENIPNWDDIRTREGVRIFIFMETAKTRWVGERTVLVKLLGEQVVNEIWGPYIENQMYFDYAGIVAVGGHEVAHNAFIVEGVSERLTPPLYAKIEEHKANLAILSQIDTLYTPEEQRIIFLYELGYSLMKMAQANDQTVVAYFNFAVFALNACMELGVVKREGDGYTLDITPEKTQAWIGRLKTALDDLAPIYDHGTPEDARAYIQKYFTQTPAVADLITHLAA